MMDAKTVAALLATLMFSLLLSIATSTTTAGPGGCISDLDSDGVCDDTGADNCTLIMNPLQRDDDEDGYGNVCDPDFNQDCMTGALDVHDIFFHIKTAAPWSPKNQGAYDINEDGVVGGASEIILVSGRIYENPGPSSRACADCFATPTAGLGLGVCP